MAVNRKELETKLRKQAREQGMKAGSRRWFGYVYGTLARSKPKRKGK